MVLAQKGFPDGSVVKNLPASARVAGDTGLIPGLGRSPGEGNGNHLQYACLENSRDRGAWWAITHRVRKVEHDIVIKLPTTTISTSLPMVTSGR